MSSSVSNPYTFNIQSNTIFDAKITITPALETTKLLLTVAMWGTEAFEYLGFSINGAGKINPKYIVYNKQSYKISRFCQVNNKHCVLSFVNNSAPFSSITLECNGKTVKLTRLSNSDYSGPVLFPDKEGATYTINIVSVTE